MFWWIFSAVFGLLLLAAAVVLIAAAAVDNEKLYTDYSPFYRTILYTLVDVILFFSRVKIEMRGMEKVPSEGRFLLVCNHLSVFDTITKVHVFRKYDLAFISKPENFTIPVVGRILRRCCFMPIDRQNPRNAMTTINHAAALLGQDEMSVAVYPEGTRSRQKVLLPFHGGVFKVAQKAKVPVVVCVVEHTDKVKERAPWKKTDVVLSVLRTIPVEEVLSKRSEAIGHETFALMQEALKESYPPLPAQTAEADA